MAVKVRVRKLRNGDMHFQADIRVRFPDGTTHRERVKAPGSTRAAAMRWARQREVHILRHGLPTKEVSKQNEEHTETRPERAPTLAEFVPRFREAYILANRLKPSSRKRWDDALRLHILPLLGDRPIDQIGAAEFQRIKLQPFAANTINCLIGNVSTILRAARDWGFAVTLPQISRVKVPAKLPEFYDFDTYRELISAARSVSSASYAVVLLGGDAGLRTGEIIALHRSDLDHRRSLITVSRNEYCGHLGDPKGGSTRQVPMTQRLKKALLELPQLGERVLYRESGETMTASAVQHRLYKAQRRAKFPRKGPHILRHTFCSHLAMRGAAPRAIQALAGHAKSSTTDVYMHLSPRALHDAIELIDDNDDE